MQAGEVSVTAIREQVARGDYQVDPQAVADAILRRLLSGAGLGSGVARAQSECSYPDTGRA
jgi:hypothetical protein